MAAAAASGDLAAIVAKMATPPREESSSSPELLEAAPHPRKVSSTSTSSGGADGGDKTNRKAKNRSRSRKNREPLGTLVYRQHDLDSIKCLVAARMTRRYIPCESGPALEKVKGSKTGELVNTGRTSFTLADGSGKLTDPFAITWFLACHDMKASNTPDQFGALMMQWHSFAMNEIRPFLTPLILRGVHDTPEEDTANNLRKSRLIDALEALESQLKKTRFIIGKKISVADVMVAVELLPLYHPNKALFAPRGHSLFTKDVAAYSVKHVTRWFKAVCATAMFTKAIDFYKKNGDPNRQPRGRNKSQSKGTAPKKEKGSGESSGSDGGGAKGEDGVDGNAAAKLKGKNTYRVSAKAKDVPQETFDLSGLTEKPLKVLCLHGYRQNDVSFRQKLGAFRKFLGKFVEFTFITAPHHVLPMSHDDINQDGRGWWFSRENDYFKSNDETDCDKGFDTSLELIEKTFQEAGPFDGVLGFSQGAALASLLCLMRERGQLTYDFQFAIMVASFKSLSSKHKQWYGDDAKKVTIPTLHVIGHNDQVIRKGVSELLLPLFEDPTVMYHSGGHYVAAKPQHKKPYLRFLHKVNTTVVRPQPDVVGAGGDASTDAVKKVVNEDSGLEVDDSKDTVVTDENQNKGNSSEDKTEATAVPAVTA